MYLILKYFWHVTGMYLLSSKDFLKYHFNFYDKSVFFRTKDCQWEVDPHNLGREGQETDLCMWIQNYLLGVTGVGQESLFEWSSAEGMNSSPLEKEAASAVAAEGTYRKATFLSVLGAPGRSGLSTGGGGRGRDMADLSSARASRGKYLVDTIYWGCAEG